LPSVAGIVAGAVHFRCLGRIFMACSLVPFHNHSHTSIQ
jgi:hypothetical protein